VRDPHVIKAYIRAKEEQELLAQNVETFEPTGDADKDKKMLERYVRSVCFYITWRLAELGCRVMEELARSKKNQDDGSNARTRTSSRQVERRSLGLFSRARPRFVARYPFCLITTSHRHPATLRSLWANGAHESVPLLHI
jgi:hypothetical protein